ncbi:MAG: hypothetical protein IKN53_07535 [Oscillibacter sp.]|nr:hypothetical protein [Oscillibacter sp.]
MKKRALWRGGIYAAGTLLLALGHSLGTTAGIGVSPILSVPYTVAGHTPLTVGTASILNYFLFVLLQIAMTRGRGWAKMLLQIPFSILFGLLLDFFIGILPTAPPTFIGRYGTYLCSMLSVAAGITMMVNMRLINNPADGFAEVLGTHFGHDTGFGKNLIDITYACISLLTQFVTGVNVGAIGAGSILSAIFVGRFVSLFSRLFRAKMLRLAGLE